MSQLYWQLWFRPEWGHSELQETPESQPVCPPQCLPKAGTWEVEKGKWRHLLAF